MTDYKVFAAEYDYAEIVRELRQDASTSRDLYLADAIEALSVECKEWKERGDALEKTLNVAFSEFAKIQKNQSWIPVTERLPECENGAEVGNIEWISRGRVYAGCFGRGGKYRDAYFRTWTDGTEGVDAMDADYWRLCQIPEPPKEET